MLSHSTSIRYANLINHAPRTGDFGDATLTSATSTTDAALASLQKSFEAMAQDLAFTETSFRAKTT